MPDSKQERLRLLPSVHEAVQELSLEFAENPSGLTWAVRRALEKARAIILDSRKDKHSGYDKNREELWNSTADEFGVFIKRWLKDEVQSILQGADCSLRRVINATGVVLHTNCGRALLAPEVAEYVAEQARAYSNLELDLETGSRGSRYIHVEDVLTELSGAESALVVNNNAAAVLLIMNSLANQKEVIVSRGELVEVGGSFRIPEVLKAGGARLVEVGTTNKTWLKDYQKAVGPDTAFFLKVHTSNYRIEGFQHSVSLGELVKLGNQLGIPVIKDLGSGSFLSGVEQGLPKEPTVQEAVKEGAALVTFSGDKLLGGPQAGIIVGKKDLIAELKNNQFTRALRVDKLTLAALAGTLRLYQKGEINRIPVWNMLNRTKEDLLLKAKYLQKIASRIPGLQAEVQENISRVGGGALPTAALFSYVCSLKPLKDSVINLERFLRLGRVPILTRIAKDYVLLDPRTLLEEDYEDIACRLEEWGHDNN